ncbi:hypothetical protein GCM10009539_82510 [Cryptosporangium japonicum]|uniref:Excalibur calcium-binding domain-containing protein n=2 Tax=Cryptosporangium japonicum TaxID=80872 RepID=A0ABP3EXL4_9ACTN
MQPLHWVLLGVGGAILAFCGLCGVVGVIGSVGDDPAPKTSFVAATESPSFSPPASAVPSSAAVPSTAAPLVGEQAPVAETSTEVDVVEPEPARTTRRAAPATRRPDPPRTTAAAPQPEPDSVYYKNCDAVRAAGAAPIHVGEPGYAKHLDRDGDGVGCE